MVRQLDGGKQPITGRQLGDFVVRERIGSGGQGEVYRAEQRTLDRPAVIKILHQSARGSGADRFLREARLASRLDHPYAAHVYAFGVEEDGLLWIAMELVRGVTLASWLETQGTVPLERFVPLLERVCEVVHTAHEQGIVHRDLKPGNIMVVARAGRLLPKLLDFGIAKASTALSAAPAATSREMSAAMVTAATLAGDTHQDAETLPARSVKAETDRALSAGVDNRLTGLGAALGSPAYMAPELWVEAAEAGASADIYALGVLSYECLTGHPPFQEPTLAGMEQAHAEQPVPPLGAELPAALDQVLRRALAKEPAQRYRDALALAGDFSVAAGVAAAGDAGGPAEVIDGALREAWIARAPAPLADVFPLLLPRKRSQESRSAVQSLVRSLSRYLGVLALAARARATGDATDSPRAVELVQTLQRRSLLPEEWIALARELTRSFADRADVHPVPELVRLVHGSDDAAAGAALDAAVALHQALEGSARAGESTLRVEAAAWRSAIECVMAACEFLLDYRLVAARGNRDSAESWMGVRRFHRALPLRARRPLQQGEVVLLDADGYPVVSLWPLVQVAPPTPGRAEEMFLLDGVGPNGARLVTEPLGFERHDEGVWGWIAQRGLGDRATTSATHADRHPYRALLSLTSDDADVFFGREREVEAAVNQLRVQPFVAVVGASGVGKSSFVQAGLVPALGSRWRLVLLRPGAHPLAALELALDRSGAALPDLRSRLERDPGALAAHLASLGADRGVLLVIDQLEEIFTLTAADEERDRFADAVARAGASLSGPTRVVVTLRDDFLVAAEQVPAFHGLVTRGMQLLTTPHESDLVRILEEPARRAGYRFEDPELPREMVREVAHRPSALALLSFAAAKLWEVRDRERHQLTTAGHREVGGVAGALAQHADRVVDESPADERPAVRELFQLLFTAEGTRAVRTRADLIESLGRGGEQVVDRLVASRLLVASEGVDGQATVEVAHEALLHAWPRLAAWRREDEEGTRRRDQLQAAARQWRDGGRDGALLWRGDLLTEYAIWRKGAAGRLSGVGAEFLDASMRAAASARRARRFIAGAAAAVVVIGALLLLWANRRIEAQRRAADGERRVAEQNADVARARLTDLRFEQARQVHLGGSSLEGLAYLREVLGHGELDPAQRYLAAAAARALDSSVLTIRAGSGAIPAVRVTPDGKSIVTSGWEGPAAVWDAATGRLIHRLGDLPDAQSLDLSADGRLVAAGSRDGAAVWDASTGALVARYDDGNWTSCVDLSPDGTRLLSGDVDGRVRLRRLGSTAAAIEVGVADGAIHSCELAAGGATFLASSQQVRIWSAADGRLLHTLGAVRPSTDARYGPDGRRVVVYAINDPIPELWDVERGVRLAALRGHAGGIRDAAFSADGRQLATAARDHTAKVWDVSQGALIVSLPHAAEVRAIAFDAAGERLVTSGGDLRVRVWEIRRGRQLASIEGHVDLVDALAFSPDGTRVITGARDGTARLWRANAVGLLGTLPAGEPLYAATLSGDGSRILTLSHNGRATVWDAARGARVAELRAPNPQPVTSTAFSMLDARIIPALDRGGRRAALPAGERIAIVDVDRRQDVIALSDAGGATCVRFSPDGRWLAAACKDGGVRLWDLERGGAPAQVLRGHTSSVNVIDFSPDGTRLASGDLFGELTVWDLATHRAIYSTKAYARSLMAIAFSPDGEHIATGGLSRPIKIWSARRPETLATLGETQGTVGLDYAADGVRLLAMHTDGQATVWDARRALLLDRIGISGEQGYWVEVSPAGDQALLTSGEAQRWDIRPYAGATSELIDRLDRALPYRVHDGVIVHSE